MFWDLSKANVHTYMHYIMILKARQLCYFMFAFFPKESTIKGKNLLQQEQILSFNSWPLKRRMQKWEKALVCPQSVLAHPMILHHRYDEGMRTNAKFSVTSFLKHCSYKLEILTCQSKGHMPPLSWGNSSHHGLLQRTIYHLGQLDLPHPWGRRAWLHCPIS